MVRKNNDFPHYVQKFFSEYLNGVCGSSSETMDSYRRTFTLFLKYLHSQLQINPTDFRVTHFTYKNVLGFLDWIETVRNCSASTRNQRLAAIKSFTKYLTFEYPDNLAEFQMILNIRQKKVFAPQISYLRTEQCSLYLNQIDRTTDQGRRDYLLFSIMFTTGIRVSELINIKVKDINLNKPRTISVLGKGQKARFVPITEDVYRLLENYLQEKDFLKPEKKNEFLFQNRSGDRLTRQAINYLVTKYKNKTNESYPNSIPSDFSPHKIRHTTAMSLMASEVSLIYIRDLLGHSSVQTTEIYAKADTEKRREAIEKASEQIVEVSEGAKWENDGDLLQWLESFGT